MRSFWLRLVGSIGVLTSVGLGTTLQSIATPSPPHQVVSWLSSQEYTAVQGTKISLIKPDGFTVASNFSGFQQLDTGASILVAEIPNPYSQVAGGFTAENLKTRGMTLLSQEKVTINGYSGQLLKVTQVANSIAYLKWIGVFGDETETILITATLPQQLEKSLSQQLQKSVLSAKWEKNRAVDPFADLNFAIENPPSLKFTTRMVNTLLYTRDGEIPTKTPEAPFVVVGQSLQKVLVSNPKQFSETRLTQTAQIRDLSIESSREISINGLKGYEIVATAKDEKTAIPLVVYQVMLFDEQDYFILQGIVGANLRKEYLDDFQRMALSLKKK
ncbi:MAG TPA: hypothetical protein DCE56_15070 [Cyanobacteria bacterium UBA8553]|nr:hypothetical protein [Cyanobacteria bacterium UBA8553]HAJ64315.1 hypothetical protein [Cyanobacteria bacterium UBA8543]